MDLLEASPQFAGADRGLRGGPCPLPRLLRSSRCCAGSPVRRACERVDVVQPALFAMMVSLARLWRSYGVEPSAVVGPLPGGDRRRPRRRRALPGRRRPGGRPSQPGDRRAGGQGRNGLRRASRRAGGASARSPGATVSSLAAVNGPSSVRRLRRAGSPRAAARVAARRSRFAPAGSPSTTPPTRTTSRRSGSELLERPRADRASRRRAALLLGNGRRPARGRAARTPSTGTATLRETVRFEQATRALIADGFGAFVEASPAPCADDGGGGNHRVGRRGARSQAAIGSLRREEGGPDRFVASLAEAHAHGVAVDWGALFAGSGARAGRAAHLRLPAPALLAAARRRRGRRLRGRPEQRRAPPAGRRPRARRRGGAAPLHRPPLAEDPPLAGRPRRLRAPRSCPAPPSSSSP